MDTTKWERYPYTSKRNMTIGQKGACATSHPLAAQAGLDVLRRGGNAIDAAVAMAACLTVVEPTSNGIGSDAFAILWTKGKLYGLNSSGPAPMGISAAKVKALGYDQMPTFGAIPVNVPGAPAAWAALNERFGRLKLEDCMKDAIHYGKHGHAVTPTVAHYWEGAYKKYQEVFKDTQYQAWFDTFAPKGRAPKVGEMVRLKDHARTLKEIAETKAESFYRGALADMIDACFRVNGGFLRKEDLASYHADWVEPLSVNYRGYDIWELPPNGQGMVALMALNMLENYDLSVGDELTQHRMIEAIKIAFAEGHNQITDPTCMQIKPKQLLTKNMANRHNRMINEHAQIPKPTSFHDHGTVYLCAVDDEGNMISYIQSNYMGFGSGIVVPATGIAMNNRGNNFTLDEDHVNCVRGGKRSYHTIIPGFITKENRPIGPFGVMGGFMQPQGHVQVVSAMIDRQLNPQAALDMPRWRWDEGLKVAFESDVEDDVIERLKERGHDVKPNDPIGGFGRGQIIIRDKNGTLYVGTDKRCDGHVAIY